MNIGDKIILKPGNQEGIITRLLHNQLIEIAIGNSFKISVLKSEIVETESVKTIDIEKFQIKNIKNPLKRTTRYSVQKVNNNWNKGRSINLESTNDEIRTSSFVLRTSIDPQKIIEKMYENFNPVRHRETASILLTDPNVDLHIENLTNNYDKMNASEMFHLQLQIFETELEKAIAAQMYSITFIHGVGKGILRNEIHNRLKQNKNIKDFEVAPHSTRILI